MAPYVALSFLGVAGVVCLGLAVYWEWQATQHMKRAYSHLAELEKLERKRAEIEELERLWEMGE